jgi:hypothetical protein
VEALRVKAPGGQGGHRILSDTDFDAKLPPTSRRASRSFWTPVRIALRAATRRTRQVLDAAAHRSCVVTHCGLGPNATLARYELVHTEQSCGGALWFWVKRPDYPRLLPRVEATDHRLLQVPIFCRPE